MPSKLVFLHIPRTSGTSFKGAAEALYGREQCLWWGEDTPPRIPFYPNRLARGKKFIAGHKYITFYPRREMNLYCSFVREPVDRVFSLFSHYMHPESASDSATEIERRKVQKLMLSRSMDPESIVNSIRFSRHFRKYIRNMQCRYLSRYAHTFDGVMKTASINEFLIGETYHSHVLLGKLSELLNWPHRELVRANATSANRADDIFEPGARELIEEHCAEDQRLYNFVTQENSMLFSSITSESLLKKSLSVRLRITKCQDEPGESGVRS